MNKVKVFIIYGYGVMGAAMAHHLFTQGHRVFVVPSQYDVIEDIPSNFMEGRIDEQEPPVLIIASNIAGLPWALKAIRHDFNPSDHDLLILTKGLICHGKGIVTVSEFIKKTHQFKSISCISGPCIANEMLQNEPTAVTLSSRHYPTAQSLADSLRSAHYRAHASTDVIGCEWASALKNIYAIVITATSAFAFNTQENFNAALFHAIHQELSNLIRYVGGDPATAFSLSGLGDIWVTCRKGRNGQFGHHWGGGQLTPSSIKSNLFFDTTVEGYQLARSIAPMWLTQTQYSQFFFISSAIQAISQDRPFTSLYMLMERQLMMAT